jgi:protein SCO1
MRSRGSQLCASARLALLLLALVPGRHALALPGAGALRHQGVQGTEGMQPPALQGVDVQERLGELVPLEAEFLDEAGRPVRLGEVLPRNKPVLLTLAYYQCPMLCNLVLSAQARAMRDMGLTLGRDYEAITVSIDPKDTPAQSHERRKRHLQTLGQEETAPWRFLTGSEESIQKLAGALGFRYRYDEATQQYAHPAVLHVLSPEGAVARYLYGASFDPGDLKLSLLEAASGRVGTSLDRVILSCYRYDPALRRYGFFVFGFIRVGAMLVFLSLMAMLTLYWRRELKRGG